MAGTRDLFGKQKKNYKLEVIHNGWINFERNKIYICINKYAEKFLNFDKTLSG